MKLRLRLAKPSDLGSLVDIEERCFELERTSSTSFRRFLKGETAICIVATVARLPVGYILITTRRRRITGHLYGIAVLPEWQGRGIGSALLRRIETLARRSYTRVRLEVRTDNDKATILYLRYGYRPIGYVKRYYTDGCDAIRLEKILNARLG